MTQGGYYPPQYGPPGHYYGPPQMQNGYGVASFVLGILALLFSLVPIIGIIAWPLLVIGAGLGFAGVGRLTRGAANNPALTTIGLVLNGLALLICVWWVSRFVT